MSATVPGEGRLAQWRSRPKPCRARQSSIGAGQPRGQQGVGAARVLGAEAPPSSAIRAPGARPGGAGAAATGESFFVPRLEIRAGGDTHAQMSTRSPSALLARDRPAELATAAPADRRAAVEALYTEHRARIAGHLYALTGDRDAIDDLINEVFLAAFEALEDFRGRSAVTTWLHGIAINVARNHRAKQRRRHAFIARFAAREAAEPVATLAGEELAAARATRQVHAALAELADPLREVFVLRVMEEHTLKTCAEILGLPISTVHERVQRATAQFRAYLEAREPAP
jgi:RNA polymerase sigma-70 factor (ECF subfamily)